MDNLDGLHAWAAKLLAPDPGDEGSSSALDDLHQWAAGWLAPDSEEGAQKNQSGPSPQVSTATKSQPTLLQAPLDMVVTPASLSASKSTAQQNQVPLQEQPPQQQQQSPVPPPPNTVVVGTPQQTPPPQQQTSQQVPDVIAPQPDVTLQKPQSPNRPEQPQTGLVQID
eukprot:m.48551 g.48551  ORF g.48551 m.48551 type:complete len:168 (-) comp10572_c0_seq1:4272-4775(-)